MQKEIITRHFNLGEEQEAMVDEALDKLEKFSPRPVQAVKLTINHEAGIFTADGVFHLKNNDFRATGEGREPEISVVEFTESIRKQLAKFKGKISGKQKGGDGGLGKAMLDGEAFLADEEGPEGFVLRDMDVEDAKESFATTDQPFFVFRNIETSRVGVIYRRDNGEMAHMESSND
ncbi:MAG: HPF/RaiA family ribosome-associated protein [bacterium]|nr:HPF/RaiA family ribosome-associated protein [bacterium]